MRRRSPLEEVTKEHNCSAKGMAVEEPGPEFLVSLMQLGKREILSLPNIAGHIQDIVVGRNDDAGG